MLEPHKLAPPLPGETFVGISHQAGTSTQAQATTMAKILSARKQDLVPHTVIWLLTAGAADNVVKLLQKQHPVDIAGILRRLPDRHRRPTFDLLVAHNPTLAIQGLTELAPSLGVSLLEDRAVDEIARRLLALVRRPAADLDDTPPRNATASDI